MSALVWAYEQSNIAKYRVLIMYACIQWMQLIDWTSYTAVNQRNDYEAYWSKQSDANQLIQARVFYAIYSRFK